MRGRIEFASDYDGPPRPEHSVRITEKRHAANQRLSHKRSGFFGLGNEQMKVDRIYAHQPRWSQRANRGERLGAENDGKLAKEFGRVERRRLRLQAAQEPYAFYFSRKKNPQKRRAAFLRNPFPWPHPN